MEVLELQEIAPEPPKSFWIFQANPKFYDIDGALRDLRELTWIIRQHADSIRTTDEVFIWRSGPDAGIVARATVLTNPADIEEQENARKFDRDPTKFEGSQLRVLLRIDERIDPPLSRQMIAEHRALAELSILRAPQGTNFPVNLQQADAILELLGDQEPLTRKPGRASPRKQQIWLMAPGRDAEYWDGRLVVDGAFPLATGRPAIEAKIRESNRCVSSWVNV